MNSYKDRPSTGRLIYAFPRRKAQVLEVNKPWGVLANLRKQSASAGYNEKYLKLTY